jgi:hypothetical protein
MGSYTIINKSDTFLSLIINDKAVSIPFGKKVTGVKKEHITSDIRYKARAGIIALIYVMPVNVPVVAPRERITRKVKFNNDDE